SVNAESCSNTVDVMEELVIHPLPDAGFASTTSGSPICPGEDAEFYLTGTVGSVISYSMNGGTDENVTVDGSGSATVTIPGAEVSQTMTLVSVTDNSTGCSKILTGSATVSVEDNIAPVVITKNITVELDDMGRATIAEDAVNNGSWDACG